MTIEHRDCVVIGGGPAGSTFASIAKKYAPALNVAVLEMARFPRYRIGESTIPAANNVFRDLEIYEALERTDFVKKMGIVFVWGENRQPWSADYLRLREVKTPDGLACTIDVTGQDFRGVIDRLGYLETPVTAFNVRRAEFDQLLLDQSRHFGADVREGTQVTEILRDAGGRIEGVRWKDDRGRSGTIMTPFVLDASGLLAVMTGRKERIYDPEMNNFAVYGYLSGAEWKVTFNGNRERSTVFLNSIDKGWIWYFPIGPDIMSVGVVTRKQHLKERLRETDLESFWWESLNSSPEIAGLVRNATVRTDMLPNGKRIAASEDWSSWARSPVGPGWAAAGDAAMFVDPILSSGVTLAIQSAHRAAYTFITARAHPEVSTEALWRAYADYIRGEYGSFLTMARHFYGTDRKAESWWKASQQVVNKAGVLPLDDHQSFTMATAGFFPNPRTNTSEVIVALLANLTGTPGDLLNIFREDGLPAEERLPDCAMEVLTPFRLDVRTEPMLNGTGHGHLEIYHDLVTDDLAFAHRLAAVPHRIPAAMAPVVAAIPRHRNVASLLAAAPPLLPPDHPPETVRRATLDVVRAAALKGFLRLTPAA
jgi:flavin-dependent dehydrogenase